MRVAYLPEVPRDPLHTTWSDGRRTRLARNAVHGLIVRGIRVRSIATLSGKTASTASSERLVRGVPQQDGTPRPEDATELRARRLRIPQLVIAQRMRITSTAPVAIGSASPTART